MASLDASLANQEDDLADLLRLRSTAGVDPKSHGSRQAFEARNIPPDGDFRRYASVLSEIIKNFQQFEAGLATAEHAHYARSNRSRLWLKAALNDLPSFALRSMALKEG